MDKILLYYANIPKGWANLSLDNFNMSKDRYDKLLSKLKGIDKSVIVYMQNACKLFVPELYNTFNYYGIDFMEYYNSTFSKDTEYSIASNKDLYIIYNIGIEKAINTEFSKKLLNGLIEKFKNEDKIIFLCSSLSYSEFNRKYLVDIPNIITTSLKKEESVL